VFELCSQPPPLFEVGDQRSACWLRRDGAGAPHQIPARV
jgi:hypothetical protein